MDKKSIRPIIPSAKTNEFTSEMETFQNAILRPILKLQHDLILDIFLDHLQDKNQFKKLLPERKREYIKNLLQKKQNLRNLYLGTIVGLLTTQELSSYLQNKTELNKRIIQMLTQRIFDSW